MRWPGGSQDKLDHALTGWALNGAHKNTGCKQCHNKANSRGAPTYLGLPKTCISCHKDVHQGRFDKACTSCHNESAWKDLNLKSFNHDTAKFALKGADGSLTARFVQAEKDGVKPLM